MSISKTWSVDSLLTRPSLDGLENIIIAVGWSVKVVYTDMYGRELAESSTQGLTYLEYPDGVFTNFSDLTETQVLDWVKHVLGPKVSEYEIQTVRHALGSIYPENDGTIVTVEKNQLPWA